MAERLASVAWATPRRSFALQGGLQLELGQRTLIMGILNTTPDSFSDGGKYSTIEAAKQQAEWMMRHGADLIDVGGESTRPGSMPVSIEVELERVLPVIHALRDNLPIPISIDTYKPEVAEKALEAGVHILNDIWGLRKHTAMAELASAYRCPIVLMHNREQPVYERFLDEVVDDLKQSVQIARCAGVEDEQIILDPGIGFGKTLEHNLLLLRRLDVIVELGYPVLLGTSRKSVIRQTLQVEVDDTIEGTGATVALGIGQGCQIIRVHDVKEMKRVAVMTDAMLQGSTSGAMMRTGGTSNG